MRGVFSKLKKFFIFSILAIFLANLFLGWAKAQTPPQPSADINWNERGNFKFIHAFRVGKDNVLRDTVAVDKNGVSRPTMIVEYRNKQSISYWDFFDPKDLRKGINESLRDYENRINTLAKRTYSIYPLPGTSTFYLIVDNDGNNTKGIFKQTSVQTCYYDGKQTCPWKYYKAYTSWSLYYVYRDGKKIKPEYKLEASEEQKKSLLYQYIEHVNSKQYSVGSETGPVSGTELTLEEAEDLFPSGKFNGAGNGVIIHDDGDNPPYFVIEKGDSSRPKDFRFTLKYILRWKGKLEANNNFFYFMASDPNYPNLTVRIDGCKDESRFFLLTKTPPTDIFEVQEIGKGQIFFNKDSLWKNLINKVYNKTDGTVTKAGTTADYKVDECPQENYINVDEDGWLQGKWGIQITSNETGGSKCYEEATKGMGITWPWQPFEFIKKTFISIGCWLFEVAGLFIKWSLDILNKAAGIEKGSFNIFQPEKAYALTLSEQLQSEQIIAGWKTSLIVTDIIVIFALLLIAFANILKLNIDVYAVKKALPGLLIGVILANFSLLISRVVVDFASLLSSWFLDLAGGKDNVAPALSQLIFGITPGLLGGIASGLGIGALIMAFFTGGLALLAIPLIFIFLMIPGFMIMALAFLLYVRLYVVWILVILSPLAFIILGFPPAQQYFKTWWSWFLKWAFLAPIAYFFIGLGAKLGRVGWGQPTDTWLSWTGHWILGMVVLAMALYVPWKLGGAIMAAWGRFGLKTIGLPAGKLLDAGIAKVTKGWSPYGLYKGIQAAYGRSWRRHEAEVTGRGKALGETLVAAPRAAWHGARSGLKERRLKGMITEPFKGIIGGYRNRQELEAARQMEEQLKETVIPYSGEKLRSVLNQAMASGDISIAAPAFVQAAREGILKTEPGNNDFEKFANAFKTHPFVNNSNVILNATEKASTESPYGPLVSNVEVKNKQVINLPEEKIRERTRYLMQMSTFNRRPDEQRAKFDNMLDERLKAEGVKVGMSHSEILATNPKLDEILKFLHRIYQGERKTPVRISQNIRDHFGQAFADLDREATATP